MARPTHTRPLAAFPRPPAPRRIWRPPADVTATTSVAEEPAMHNDKGCGECPVAAASRRAFLHDVAIAVAGALAVGVASAPSLALAESLVETKAISRRGNQKSYMVPRADSI